MIRRSLKQYLPVFPRVTHSVTSKVPWVSGSEIFRTRTSDAQQNAQYTFGLPPSQFDYIREETGTFPPTNFSAARWSKRIQPHNYQLMVSRDSWFSGNSIPRYVCEKDCKRQSSHASPGQPVCNLLWARWLTSRVRASSRDEENNAHHLRVSGPGPKLDSASSNPFQLAAADALNVAEAPLLPILSREARFPNRSSSDVSPALSPSPATNPYARPYTRHTRLRRSPSSIRTSPKFLYFRDASTNVTVRLMCPDCSRGDFPRVQSLLNHCRIQHGREFGSHDECIRGCAVQVPADEETWVIENGSELRQSGLPSLRRLFEIAVGGAGSSLGTTSTNDTSRGRPDVGQEDNRTQEREISQDSTPIPLSSTHLSRTLGHHAESPALAPFLGRASKRRGIMTHDENTPVDIDGGEEVLVRRRWHKPFIHRSRARPSLDIAIATPAAETPAPQCTPNITPVTQGTRFHVVSRVTISDRSLWIPVGGYRRGE